MKIIFNRRHVDLRSSIFLLMSPYVPQNLLLRWTISLQSFALLTPFAKVIEQYVITCELSHSQTNNDRDTRLQDDERGSTMCIDFSVQLQGWHGIETNLFEVSVG